MKAAVPMFDQDVAPRFGYADRFLVAEIEGEEVVHFQEVSIHGKGWPTRLEEIREMGICILLCCGFNRHFIPLSENMGIQVITGLAGDGRELLERFARGELFSTPGQGAGRGAGHHYGRGNGRGSRGGLRGRGPGRNGQGRRR